MDTKPVTSSWTIIFNVLFLVVDGVALALDMKDALQIDAEVVAWLVFAQAFGNIALRYYRTNAAIQGSPADPNKAR